MIRIIAFLFLAFCALMTPVWFFALLAFGYALVYGPYELFALSILIDARFGEIERSFPYVYTAITILVVGIIKVVRPRLHI